MRGDRRNLLRQCRRGSARPRSCPESSSWRREVRALVRSSRSGARHNARSSGPWSQPNRQCLRPARFAWADGRALSHPRRAHPRAARPRTREPARRLTVVDVHMELQRLVPGQCRSGTRRRRGRAEMMPAVGHPNQRTGPSARSCSRQSVAGRRRRVQQQTTVIEAHDRRASAQPRTAEPNVPLQRPDPVIDYGGESTLEHAGDRLLAAQLPNAMLAHVHTSDIVPRAIQAETRTPAAGVREGGPDQASHPSKPATQRPLRAAQRAASLTDPPLGPSPGAAAKKRARIRGLFF